MSHNHSHSDIVENFYNEQKEIFDSSHQAMYAFLDDDSRVCNEKFATMLGYGSAHEWASVDVQGSFPDSFVARESQEALVEAYQQAMEEGVGSTLPVTWKKKSGESVDSTVMLVPILYEGHLFALHFISEK